MNLTSEENFELKDKLIGYCINNNLDKTELNKSEILDILCKYAKRSFDYGNFEVYKILQKLQYKIINTWSSDTKITIDLKKFFGGAN